MAGRSANPGKETPAGHLIAVCRIPNWTGTKDQVVVVVVVGVVVVVDGFGLVVVGAVVGAAVGGGRVGSGGEVGLGIRLDPAVVLGIPALLLVGPST